MRSWKAARAAQQLFRGVASSAGIAESSLRHSARCGGATPASAVAQQAQGIPRSRLFGPLQALYERGQQQQQHHGPHPDCQATHQRVGPSWAAAGLFVAGLVTGAVAPSQLHFPSVMDRMADGLKSYAHSIPALHTPSMLSGGESRPASPPPGFLGPHFIADAAAKAAPAVVNITVRDVAQPSAGGSGSGFIFDAEGSIMTNAHVIAEALPKGAVQGHAGLHPLMVSLQDGRVFHGRVTDFDRVSDLAMIKVDSPVPLPYVKLGNSRSLRVGEWVLALGSPLHLQNSVTAGIVSCVDRKGVELGLSGVRSEFLQTDCSINRGNSGGPLVNIAGEVVGLACFKALSADGISFAIPIDVAKDVMTQLKQHGRVIRPYIGIKMLQLNEHNSAQIRSRDPTFPSVSGGILVAHVTTGSPAERAGLQKGDVIVGFGESKETSTTALICALTQHVHRKLPLHVLRQHNERAELHIVASEAVQ